MSEKIGYGKFIIDVRNYLNSIDVPSYFYRENHEIYWIFYDKENENLSFYNQRDKSNENEWISDNEVKKLSRSNCFKICLNKENHQKKEMGVDRSLKIYDIYSTVANIIDASSLDMFYKVFMTNMLLNSAKQISGNLNIKYEMIGKIFNHRHVDGFPLSLVTGERAQKTFSVPTINIIEKYVEMLENDSKYNCLETDFMAADFLYVSEDKTLSNYENEENRWIAVRKKLENYSSNEKKLPIIKELDNLQLGHEYSGIVDDYVIIKETETKVIVLLTPLALKNFKLNDFCNDYLMREDNNLDEAIILSLNDGMEDIDFQYDMSNRYGKNKKYLSETVSDRLIKTYHDENEITIKSIEIKREDGQKIIGMFDTERLQFALTTLLKNWRYYYEASDTNNHKIFVGDNSMLKSLLISQVSEYEMKKELAQKENIKIQPLKVKKF